VRTPEGTGLSGGTIGITKSGNLISCAGGYCAIATSGAGGFWTANCAGEVACLLVKEIGNPPGYEDSTQNPIGPAGSQVWDVNTIVLKNPSPASCGPFTFYDVLSSQPWFQTKDLEVFALGNIRSEIPQGATDPYFSLEGLGGNPGVVSFAGSSVDFGQGEVSSQGWLANSSYLGPKIDYQYLLNRLRVDLTKAKAFPALSPSESGIYYSASGQTITNSWQITGGIKVIVFVDGNLTIEKNVTVDQDSFLALIASGNITFTKEVTKAQGLFVASKSIIISSASPNPDVQFQGEGTFIGWEGFQLNRDLGETANKTTPAEIFSSRPDLWLNFPSEFTYSLTYREELLP